MEPPTAPAAGRVCQRRYKFLSWVPAAALHFALPRYNQVPACSTHVVVLTLPQWLHQAHPRASL